MKRRAAVRLAAASWALGATNAKMMRWDRDNSEREYRPAQETLGVMPGLLNAPIPMTTSPPRYTPKELEKRASTDNTCAYVSGSNNYPLYCDATAYCASSSINSHVGCCPDRGTTTCNIWTTCLDSTQRSEFTTDNGLTLWCGFSDYPHCITHIYADSTGAATALRGYTLLGCAVAAGVDSVYFNPFIFSTTSTSSGSKQSASTTTTSPTAILPGQGTTTVTSTATVAPAASTTPVAAIAGGVVGGVVALSLIVFGIWFLMRRSDKPGSEPAISAVDSGGNPPAPIGTSGGIPATQMTQMTPPPHGYFGQDQSQAAVGGFAAMGQRSSLAKPPYTGYDNSYNQGSTSPPASPPLEQAPSYQANQSTPSPPPPNDRHHSYSSYSQPTTAAAAVATGGYAAGNSPPYAHDMTPSPQGYQASAPVYGASTGYPQQHRQSTQTGYEQSQQRPYQQPSPGYEQPQPSPGYQQPQPSPGYMQPQHSPGYGPQQMGGYQQPQQSDGYQQSQHDRPPPSAGYQQPQQSGGGYQQSQHNSGYHHQQPHQPYPQGGYRTDGHTVELSTQRGDSEVRELEG